MAGGEHVQAELAGEHGQTGHRGAENRDARLPGEEAGDRHEQRRFVVDDDRGIESRDLRHERVEAVPEREGVARVQAAVLELVEGAEVEVAELDELADAREVEEAVAGDDARDVPQGDAEGGTADEDERAAARPRHVDRTPDAGGERDDADGREHPEGERDVPVDCEDDGPGDEDGGQAEHERRRCRAPARRTRDQGAGQEHHRGRGGETDVVEDHESSEATSPEARKRAPSR